MAVGGEGDPDKLARRHFEACARDVGIKPSWVVEAVGAMAEAIERELPRAVDASRTARSPAAERVVPLVRKQARRVARAMARR